MADKKDKKNEKELFPRFGEMGTFEELNHAAEGLKAEGDIDSLKALAAENGLDPEDAEDYATGDVKQLVTLRQAALGRIKVQRKNTNIPAPAADIIYEMARTMTEDPEACRCFLQKGARIDKVWEKLRETAKENQKNGAGVACGTDRDLKEIIMKAVAE